MAKGSAVVESKPGRAEIDAHFDHLEAPARFGREYLTYVLWAITPDGHRGISAKFWPVLRIRPNCG